MESAPRSLAILFADVTDSTKLYETLGDVEALETIGRCLDIIRLICEDHGGRVIKTIGDGSMAVFPVAANAAYASIAMHVEISKQRTSRGLPLSIHTGFHYGPIIGGDADVFGDSVNVAARLSALAKAGQTLVSAQTLEVLSPALRARTRDQDMHTLKGKQEDIAIFELIWQDSEEELTTMAGRLAARPAHLRLSHGDRNIELDETTSALTIGRDHQSDVVIADRKASRLHARIERRRDKFVLVDQSSNGTYCMVEGEEGILLRHEELILRGSGRISFGNPHDEGTTEYLEFSCLD
jgi:class 3 adenylate cyclase